MLRPLVAATAALAALATPTAAAPVRTVDAPYQVALGITGKMAEVNCALVTGTWCGSATLFPKRGERRVSITVTDTTGLPVLISVRQDAKRVDGTPDTMLGEFCGSTPDLPIRGDRGKVTVFVLYGDCAGDVSVPTTGVATARFS